jgi:hypothetical protein
MKRGFALTAVILLFVAGCAATERQKVIEQPSVCRFLGEACHDLTPGRTADEPSLRYANPKAQFTQYKKVRIDVVGFFGSDTAKVSPEARQTLTDLFHKSLNESLAKKYEVVEKGGPDTMKVQVAILDAEAATPGARSVTMVIPQLRLPTMGIAAITGKYPFSGGGQAAARITDSMTDQLLGAAVDRRTGGGAIETAAQWEWGDADNAIKKWSEMIATNLYAYTSGAKKP